MLSLKQHQDEHPQKGSTHPFNLGSVIGEPGGQCSSGVFRIIKPAHILQHKEICNLKVLLMRL